MTGIIPTIQMGICRFSTLMADADHIIRNPFTHPGIKDKILANKF